MAFLRVGYAKIKLMPQVPKIPDILSPVVARALLVPHYTQTQVLACSLNYILLFSIRLSTQKHTLVGLSSLHPAQCKSPYLQKRPRFPCWPSSGLSSTRSGSCCPNCSRIMFLYSRISSTYSTTLVSIVSDIIDIRRPHPTRLSLSVILSASSALVNLMVIDDAMLVDLGSVFFEGIHIERAGANSVYNHAVL
ncbi:hypothetical protein PSPO01_13530 [Paraphaeosphaeria sporulosa]